MKKLLTIFAVLIAFASVQIFAQQSENYFQVNTLLKKGLFKYENEITNLANNLTTNEREFLYIENKKDSAALPFCLNFFVGWGLGSFIQGDTKTGLIHIGGELLGGILMLAGSQLATPSASPEAGIGMVFAGLAITAGVAINSWVQPFLYTNKYNNTLRKCLSGNQQVSVQFAPIVDFDNSKYGLLASLKI